MYKPAKILPIFVTVLDTEIVSQRTAISGQNRPA